MIATILVVLAVAFVVVDNEPPKKKALPVISMESHAHTQRLVELRQDAWQRASRSITRQQGRHEWKVKQVRIEAKRAAEARRQATIEAKRQAASNNQPQTTSTRVDMSGIAGCIAKYESGGNPRAENPTTTASGLYQFVDGTWNNYGGYSRASLAPASVQTEKFYQVWNGGQGAGNWVVAPRCGY